MGGGQKVRTVPLLLILFVSPFLLAININSLPYQINTSNDVYTVTGNLSTIDNNGVTFNYNTTNSTLDCQGFNLTVYDYGSAAETTVMVHGDSHAVKNCFIHQAGGNFTI